MPVTIDVNTSVEITSADFINQCGIDDICCFACQLAEKLDKDFAGRSDAAAAFADGMSENGVRWLSEVVTSFYGRQR